MIAPMGPLTGVVLLGGEYCLENPLGGGGQAIVYQASSKTRNGPVAIKIVRLAGASGSTVSTLLDEYQTLAKLPPHPNLVEVYFFDEETSKIGGANTHFVYIVMALAPNGTLRSLVSAEHPLDPVATATLIHQVASALDRAHQFGLIHRDVKPGNVLLAADNWPLLADFGIAVLDQDASEGVIGTPEYMAPEIWEPKLWNGKAADPKKSDQYALAATTFELLTGTQPFSWHGPKEERVPRLKVQHLAGLKGWPPASLVTVPEGVREVVEKGLDQNPDARYPSVAAFADALLRAAWKTREETIHPSLEIARAVLSVGAAAALRVTLPGLIGLIPSGGRVLEVASSRSTVAFLLALILVAFLLQAQRGIGALFTWLGIRLRTALGQAPAIGDILASAVGLFCAGLAYALLVGPVRALAAEEVGPPFLRLAPLLPAACAALLARRPIGTMYRSGGPLVTAALVIGTLELLIAIAPGSAGILGSGLLAGEAGFALLVGALGVLLYARHVVRIVVARVLSAQVSVSPSKNPPTERTIGLVGAFVDLVFLLVGFAALNGAVASFVGSLDPSLDGKIGAVGLALAVWLVATLRLGLLAGTLGLALGLVAGFPLVLPLLGAALWPSWPWSGVGALAWAVSLIGCGVLVLRRQPRDERSPRGLRRQALGTFAYLLPVAILAGFVVLGNDLSIPRPAQAAAPVAGATAATVAVAAPTAEVAYVVVDDSLRQNVPALGDTTYDLTLTCSDGRLLGRFEETVPRSSTVAPPRGLGAPRPANSTPCAAWRDVYARLRDAMGLPTGPSFSWNLLDVRMVVNDDSSVDVVETHQLSYTHGAISSVTWPLALSADVPVSDVAVLEGAATYPLDPAAGAGLPFARDSIEQGKHLLGWSFPPVDSPAERAYTLRYRFPGTIQPVDGANRLLLPVLAPEHDQTVWHLTLKVWLASNIGPGRVSLVPVGGGSSIGEVSDRSTTAPDRIAWFDLSNLAPGAGVQAVVDFPASAPTPVAPTSSPTLTPLPSATPRPPTPTLVIVASPAAPAPTPTATATAVVALTPTASPPPPTPTVTSGSGNKQAGGPPAAIATPKPPLPSSTPRPTSSPTPRPTLSPTPIPCPTVTVVPTVTMPPFTPTPRPRSNPGSTKPQPSPPPVIKPAPLPPPPI